MTGYEFGVQQVFQTIYTHRHSYCSLRTVRIQKGFKPQDYSCPLSVHNEKTQRVLDCAFSEVEDYSYRLL